MTVSKKGFSTIEKRRGFTMERCWFSTKEETKADLVRYMRVDEPLRGFFVQNDPFKTVWSDLRKTEEEILAGATNTIKYEVKRCLKEDVDVCFAPDGQNTADIETMMDEFERSYIDFARSLNNEHLFRAYDRHRIEILRNNGRLMISKAITPDITIYHVYAWGGKACCLLFSVSNFRSDPSLRNMAGRMNKMLHIKDMRWFRDRGVYWYDWGNISRSGQQAGIDQFKVAFGGEIVEQYNVMKGQSLKGKVLILGYKMKNLLYHA